MTDPVIVQRQESILHIHINRPEKKNALTHQMYSVMAQALRDAENDLSLSCVLFTGEGGNFTAGNDLIDFHKNPPKDRNAPVFRLIIALAKATIPLIAAVNGVAVGIGTTLLPHCDLAFADETARFRMPFLDLGLLPEAGSTYLLPKIMGHTQAAELILMGSFFDATKAKEVGLINKVTTSAELHETAWAAARALATKPQRTLRKAKSLLKGDLSPLLQQIDKEADLFAKALDSAEWNEALNAFMQKRKPDFSKCI